VVAIDFLKSLYYSSTSGDIIKEKIKASNQLNK
jgi:hypothetical protein